MSDLAAADLASFFIFHPRAKKKVIPPPKPKVKVTIEPNLVLVIMVNVEMHS